MNASKQMQQYFKELEKQCFKELAVAESCRKKSYDPTKEVETALAKNMAERVIGIIAVVAPQIRGKGAEKRIQELEKEYGVLDWRVALKISEEIARQKFCTFKDEREAMEVGIRAGFTYVTVGVVSSPLEGFTSLELKDRMDGTGKYFCLNYSGPIRNAGGTAAAVSVIIGDYVRVKFGYKEYDPTEKEVKRCFAEMMDYHEWIANLQYVPSEAETEFLLQRIPVEVSGDPSEKYEVSNINLKDLPRVQHNRLRSGYCLIHSSCIPLKAPKLWKQLSVWGEEFSMGHWKFLEEFLVLQKKMKAQGKKAASDKLAPDYTFIHDLVAGRPVFGHPSRQGGFRLRYGRSRTSGFSGQSLHPATMVVMNEYIATATQLKVERPGKAAAFTVCDTIEGPVVKLESGDVVCLNNEREARKIRPQIKEIIYAGDILINWGDFLNRAHVLAPAGYCEEYWIQEVEERIVHLFGTLDFEKAGYLLDEEEGKLRSMFSNPLGTNVNASTSIKMSTRLGCPLHPAHTFKWRALSAKQLKELVVWLKKGKTIEESEYKLILPLDSAKRYLELIACPHKHIQNEHSVIQHEALLALKTQLDFENIKEEDLSEEGNALNVIISLAAYPIRDKLGISIGARMGRPEKAKMRKLTGSPHALFPIGEQGGKLRSFQEALVAGNVEADFGVYWCGKCKKEQVLPICITCEKPTEKKKFCTTCGVVDECPHEPKPFKRSTIPIREYFNYALKKGGTSIYPDLIKGVRGTVGTEHIPEHPLKGILRAKHSICVNKDGTTRYDISEVTMTHFKPKEVGTSVEKLRELGYTSDVYGKPLDHEDQVLELKVQDVALPSCPDSPDLPCDEILYRTANFMDELLVSLYGQKPFYNLQNRADLVGHLVIGLAPHTSAGILGRIVGFTKTQGFFAHPLYHAAMRRDCDGDESCVVLLLDCLVNFSKSFLPSSRGSTMDAPIVLTYILTPSEVDDMAFDVDRVWKYPLKLYRAAEQYKMPWDVPLDKIGNHLGKPGEYEGMGFTHDTDNINAGVLCSAYKLLPSMQEKLMSQMDLAEKLRATTASEVAALVIEKHFIRDIKGNLRKFSQQEFRCVNCNAKYRRPPLKGNCTTCNGKIIFTIAEGSVIKYLGPSISLAKKYGVSTYLQQTLELTQQRIDELFGKDKEKQLGLGAWFG
ncbi:MAG: DNA polymerase II large subunit [Candidatus Woesearchaeota archaeon]